MKTEAQLRGYVMRRVYLMYYTRAVSKPVPRMAVFAVLALALVGSVSIVNVLVNALSVGGVGAFVTYVAYAFAGTEHTVQLITVALVALGGWFAFDTARNLHLVPTRSEAQF